MSRKMRIEVIVFDQDFKRKQFTTHDYESLQEVKSKVERHLKDHHINVRVNVLEKPKRSMTITFMVRAAYSDNQKQQSLNLPVFYLEQDALIKLLKKIM